MWEMWVQGKIGSPWVELMTYESEVNNGGHDLYFFNTGNCGDIEKEMSVLLQVLPPVLRDNLQKAHEAYLLLETEEEKAEALLSACDDVFWDNELEIMQILDRFAAQIQL